MDAELAAPAPGKGIAQRKVDGAALVEQRKAKGGTADERTQDPQAAAPYGLCVAGSSAPPRRGPVGSPSPSVEGAAHPENAAVAYLYERVGQPPTP
ncbi:hypothetical protein [Streptomyces noursei]|uniref:Uncharacterized protein n=1 Tax=Streptomyces noursei TaxID=1971 RepID=A0A2N8P7Q4_STRNR|nr:hypothetical protein [Streptomyces noursei]PNE37049.1 hypothetical protein AOB60_21790 [Streptomyces noursei]